MCTPSSPGHPLFWGHGIGPIAVEHAEVEVLLCREMGHTGEERMPERPIIGPSGKDFVDGRIVNGRFPLGSCGTGKHFHGIPVERIHKMR